MSKVLVVIPDGFEEMETVAPVDLLRRAEVEVVLAGLDKKQLTGRSGIHLLADALYADVAEGDFDLIVIPGGPGHTAMRAHQPLLKQLQEHVSAGKTVAAICAAPTVLLDAGLLANRKRTGHFSIAAEVGPLEPDPVVVDGPIITSQGAGTATRFGLALVEHIKGPDTAEAIAKAICL